MATKTKPAKITYKVQHHTWRVENGDIINTFRDVMEFETAFEACDFAWKKNQVAIRGYIAGKYRNGKHVDGIDWQREYWDKHDRPEPRLGCA